MILPKITVDMKVYLNAKLLIERLKGEEIYFGFNSVRKNAKKLIAIFDNTNLIEQKQQELIDSNVLVRYFDADTLVKLKSLLNRPHSINIVGI